MKKTFLYIFLLSISLIVCGQPETVRAIVSAGSTQNNTYIAVGQPFYLQTHNGRYEVAYSVAQAQIVKQETEEQLCENEPYTGDAASIPDDQLTVGTHNYEQQYNLHVDEIFGYDRLSQLTITVWPVTTTQESVSFSGTLPVIDGSLLQNGESMQLVTGENILVFRSSHGCDSIVTLYATACPLTVRDADGNEYPVVELDNYCWTKRNLMTTHYDGEENADIARAMIYNTPLHPDEADNEATYGRLYTWYSAVGVEEGSNTQPVLNADGFVQGICPNGWHIPAAPEVSALNLHSLSELKSEELWVFDPGTNSTGFSLLPAGFFNATTNRFEAMLSDARLWFLNSDPGLVVITPAALNYAYFCESPISNAFTASDAYSVRCVKDYQQ